jgi:hypothetical protein
MKVLLRHEGVWLLIKEVYAIRRSVQRRRGRQKRNVTPYGTVAGSVDRPPLDGYKPITELEVPATKVMRFIVKMFQAPGDAVITVEPRDREYYIARIYARSKEAGVSAARLAEEVLAQLRTRKSEGKLETAGAAEAEEEEEELELEGEEEE